MTLHTVGPTSMAEDESRIGKAYQTWLTPILVALPLITAQYADLKWVVAVGFAGTLVMLHEAGGRLHDLCIRHRRTNLLLSQQAPPR